MTTLSVSPQKRRRLSRNLTTVTETKSLPTPSAQTSSRKYVLEPVIDDGDDEDEEGVVYMVVPPDGGWGWIVMIASILINCVTDGQMFAFGALIPALTKEFQSADGVAMIASVVTGTEMFVGPIVSALCNRWGFRIVAIVGCSTASFAFSISHFATSTTMLCLTYGLIGGFGVGMAYVPAVVSVGFYFERWRGLATGFASCGSSIGGTILSYVFSISIENYGWRKTLLLQAALVATGTIFALAYRPLLPVRVVISPKNSSKSTPANTSATHASAIHTSISGSYKGSRFIGLRYTNYPTLAQQLGSGVALSRHRPGSNTSYISGHKLHSTIASRRMSLADPDTTSIYTVCTPRRVLSGTSIRMMPAMSGNNDIDEPCKCCGILCCKCCNKKKKYNHLGVRPMYRDDAHYTGSLKMLPEYIATGGSIGYHMTVTRLPTVTDVEQEYSSKCVICPEAVTRALATMLDMSLLNSPSFLLFCLSTGFTFMGYFIPYMFITERANQVGIPPEKVKYLLMTINISNMIGRVIGGLLASLRFLSPILINIVALFVAGLSTVCSGLSTSFVYQLVYSTTYGFSMACVASQRTLILVELLGLEKLTNAFGLQLLVLGIFNTLGLSISGILIKAFDNYNVCFWYGGAWIIAAGVLAIPVKNINQKEKAKAKEKERHAANRPLSTV